MTDFFVDRYLGDGVYASFDGFQIWLAVGDHTNRVIALEPSVFANLIQYKDELVLELAKQAGVNPEGSAT